MVRAFLAFDLDEQLVRDAAALSEALRGQRALARARWVSSSVMHVTLRFLGDTDPSLLPALASVVTKLGAGKRAVDVRVSSLVAFSEARRARILALHLEDDDALGAIAAEAETHLAALGFAPEPRPYRPHLTIARLREPADLRRLIDEQSVALTGRVSSIGLYQSELGSRGPTYTRIARCELAL
jgi:RNA 2',3'-cyclic 3'-phosphodiesterase